MFNLMDTNRISFTEFKSYYYKYNNMIHDLSLGGMLGYNNILAAIKKDKVRCYPEYIIFLQKTPRVFLYRDIDLQELNRFEYTNIEIVTNLQLSLKKKSKHTEVLYDLSFLERSAFSSHKSYYNAVSRPINIVEKKDISIIDIDNTMIQDLINLHTKWLEFKFESGVYRLSFPTARYRRCLEISAHLNAYKKAIYINGELYGFIIFSIEGDIAFELAFVSLYWEDKFKIVSGLNQYLFSYFLLELKKIEIKYVNAEYSLNKNLKIFKECVCKSTIVDCTVFDFNTELKHGVDK